MYSIPKSLDEALSVLAQDRWIILSGGTDIYPAQGDRPLSENVLDVSKISGLRKISTASDGTLSIGALSTWTDLINADLAPSFDGLKLAAREVGSVQIQNRATIVGNICNASPAADGVPPLLTLGATVKVKSQNTARDIPLAAFILGNRKTSLNPEEMVTEITVPASGTRGNSSFIKLGSRKYLVISISMVAARLATNDTGFIDDAAISVGSCSIVAKRLPDLEAALLGNRLNREILDRIDENHLRELSPIDDVRATKEYRLAATKELVKRAIRNLVEAD